MHMHARWIEIEVEVCKIERIEVPAAEIAHAAASDLGTQDDVR